VFSKFFKDHPDRKSFSFPGHSHQEVHALLQFIYSGKLDIKDQPIPKLFETAKKYEIQGLKKECQKLMIKILNSASAIQTLIFAEINKCEPMKKSVLRFIKKDKKSLENGFGELMEYPDLIKELICFEDS
jgi:hypothetical protein